jgi:hypothetical protein
MSKGHAKVRLILLPFAIVIWGFGWFLSLFGEKKSRKASISISQSPDRPVTKIL